MARGKKFTAEQIIGKLREAEVGLAQGKTVPDATHMSGNCERGRGLRRREKNATEAGAGRYEKPAPDTRAAAPESPVLQPGQPKVEILSGGAGAEREGAGAAAIEVGRLAKSVGRRQAPDQRSAHEHGNQAASRGRAISIIHNHESQECCHELPASGVFAASISTPNSTTLSPPPPLLIKKLIVSDELFYIFSRSRETDPGRGQDRLNAENP